MKTYLLAIVFILAIQSLSFGQTQAQKDSLMDVMCKDLESLNKLPMNYQLDFLYKKHMTPFIMPYPEDYREAILLSILNRFRRSCRAYATINKKLGEPSISKSDWKILEKPPKKRLSKRLCKKFMTYDSYAYLESDGDTTHVDIDDEFWIDRFTDGTYSKVKIKWLDHCTFELEFVESNNKYRSALSIPGDKYYYTLIDKKDDYYLVAP